MSIAADLRIVDDLRGLSQAAAEEFVNQATGTVRANGRFTVALSGGSTPRSLFSLLATTFRDQLPWDKMFFFWGDERHVPPDHPESNYRMAYEALLSKVPVPAENVFRVPAEIPDANQAAADYEQTLRKFFQVSPGAFPRFDLILLGMGPDGHTASLFPGTSALQEKSLLVVANWVEKFKVYRITFTLPVLNNAAVVTFLVGGADKAETVREVLEGTQPAELFPSKLIHPTNGRLMWMLDQAAAAALSKP
jgi:6-phosphogluconolactonase